MPPWVLSLGIMLGVIAQPAPADEAAGLGKIIPDVLGKEQRTEAAGMIERDIRRRTAEVNARNREEWNKIKTRAQWEKYRDAITGCSRTSRWWFPTTPRSREP